MLCSSVPDQMSAVGDTMVGVIPPIVKPAPTIPPAASRQGATGHNFVPASPGNTNPNGGTLLVPWTKMGWFPGAFVEKKVGLISPGGLPRNSSWTLAGVSQLVNIPNPPRNIQDPFPLISQAAPIRGPGARGVRSKALCVGVA